MSTTVYVVNFDPAKLGSPAHLRIEVLFEFPDSTVDQGTWGLALNLKRGTATDLGPDADTPVGPICKFHPANESYDGVWLTGTVPDPANSTFLDDRSYQKYRTPSTVFGLRADLTHTGLNYGGSASLTLSDNGLAPRLGTLTEQNFGPSTGAEMAIGIALVNQGGAAKTVSVRLLSFAIWTRPIEIEIEHILLKHYTGPDPQVIVPLERTKI